MTVPVETDILTRSIRAELAEDVGTNPSGNVLSNDTDPDGPSMTAVLVSGPANASLFALNPNGVAITPDGAFVYVASFFGGQVSVISTASNTVVATIPAFSVDVSITPEGAFAYVTQSFGGSDVLVIDTPGRDDAVARAAILKADTLVTPMNDSFVDLDLIGQVHPENYKITRPSFYAELIWNSRTQRAKATGKSVDWVVLRNRLQHIQSHNLQRVGAALVGGDPRSLVVDGQDAVALQHVVGLRRRVPVAGEGDVDDRQRSPSDRAFGGGHGST